MKRSLRGLTSRNKSKMTSNLVKRPDLPCKNLLAKNLHGSRQLGPTIMLARKETAAAFQTTASAPSSDVSITLPCPVQK